MVIVTAKQEIRGYTNSSESTFHTVVLGVQLRAGDTNVTRVHSKRLDLFRNRSYDGCDQRLLFFIGHDVLSHVSFSTSIVYMNINIYILNY